MSSSSVVSLSSFNLLFFTQVLTVLTSSLKYNEYVTDKGKNISIPCNAGGNIMWVKENGTNSTIVQTGKFLVLTNVTTADGGLYICFASVPAINASSALDTDDVAVIAVKQNANATAADAVAVAIAAAEVTATSTLSSQTGNTISSTVAISSSAERSDEIVSTTSPLPTLTVMRIAVSSNALANSTSSNSSSSSSSSSSSNSRSSNNSKNKTLYFEEQEEEFQAFQKINLIVRTPPGPVTQLYFKASTILGFLIWRFNKTNSGGYPLRSFTAEFRNVSYNEPPYNSSFEHAWSRMDPINIAPNVRQMEVYRLEPNTTYEFRIWANNHLGSGEVVTTNVTTLPETKEEDLIRLIQPDLDNFDPRIWIIAVSVVLGTLVILAIGLCIVLSKECYQSSQMGTENNANPPSNINNSTANTANDCNLNAIVIA